MRIFLLVVLIAALLLKQPPLHAQEERIKIGVSSALTGGASNYGLDVKDALLFAAKKFGEGRYEFIFEDDKCDGKTAVAIANKFVNIDKVDFVVGFACSGAALSALPVYERAQLPVIITCASSPKIADAGEYIFRTTPSDIHAAQRLFAHISPKHSSIAVLSEETDYAQDLKDAFVKASRKSEVKIFESNYLPDTRDFKPMLLKIRTRDPEGVFINTQTEAAFATILKQMDEMRWSPSIYGAYWPASPAFLELAKSSAEDIEFVDLPSLDFMLNEGGKEILAEFLRGHGKIRSVESVFATTFEALRVIDQALVGDIGFREYLYTRNFDGIFGKFSFDKKGEIEGLSFMMKKISGGKAIPLS